MSELDPLNPGQILRNQREKMGLSLNDIAVATKINPKILKALEDGQKEALPPRSFVRGFIRSYANYLKLKPEPILEAFEMGDAPSGTIPSSQPQDNDPSPAKSSRSDVSRLEKSSRVGTIMVTVGIIVLIVLIFGVKNMMDKYASERVIDKPAIESEEPEKAGATDGAAAEGTPETTTGEETTGAAIGAAAPTNAAATATDGTTTATAGTPGAAGTTTLPAPPEKIDAKIEAKAATEKKEAEEKKTAEEKKAAEAKAATDKKEAELKAAADKKTAEEKAATEKKQAELKAAADKKEAADKAAADAKVAADKKAADAKVVAEKKAQAAKETADAKALAVAPQEVIIEALDDVTIAVAVDGGGSKKVILKPDSVYTVKAKSDVTLEVSDGGLVNIIHNGNDKGNPGTLGKVAKVKYP